MTSLQALSESSHQPVSEDPRVFCDARSGYHSLDCNDAAVRGFGRLLYAIMFADPATHLSRRDNAVTVKLPGGPYARRFANRFGLDKQLAVLWVNDASVEVA